MVITSRPWPGRTPHVEADVAAHVRTQLLRRIAHDIASPTGVAMTALDELAAAREPRADLVAMASRSLRRLLRLSEQLAVVAELEEAEVDPELVRLDARALVRQSVEEAASVDGRKDVSTSCDLPPEPVHIAGEQRLLRLALREIVGNALRLATTRVRVTLAPLAGSIAIRVEDDGPGFAEEALSTLGQRFVTRPSRGLGLSLSMATDIVEAHGGRLELDASALPADRRGSRGAALTVFLPAAL